MKKQFRNTKAGIKFLDENKQMSAVLDFSYAQLIGNINFEDRVDFITCLDQDSEDWDITEQSFLYFARTIIEGLKEEQKDNEQMFNDSVYEAINNLKIWADKSKKQFLK